MLIRIPSDSKQSKNEALARVIETTAANTGLDEYKVAEAMTWFLESLADEVTRGRMVQIPGFGAFFPVPDAVAANRSRVRRCRVRFHPAVGFQQQVKHGSPPQETIARKYRNYRCNHSAGDSSSGHHSRVFTSMKYFRDEISRQLAHVRS